MRSHPLTRFIPAGIVIALAGLGWWKLHSNQVAAERLADEMRQRSLAPDPERKPVLSAISAAQEDSDRTIASVEELQEELDSITGSIVQQTASLEATRTQVKEWQSKIPIASDEITSSLGRIHDMGREIGQMVAAWARVLDPESAEVKAETVANDLSSGMLRLVGWSSQIGEMESIPADIAQFQAAALSSFYNLDEDTADKLEPIITACYAEMAADGLTVPDRPEKEEYEDWKNRRGAALAGLMSDLHPMLPEREPKLVRVALPFMLNLGLGMETVGTPSPDGEGQATNLSFPSWPTPPWLPGEK